MTNEFRVGLIGYGMSGRVFHAPLIQSVPALKLTKVVQRRADDSRERYPWVEVVQDAAAVFADLNIDLVVITTPNDSHYEFTRKALLANKHVVVEKPFANGTREAQELIDLAHQQQRVLSVFQNRRWDGDFLTVKQVLRSGLLGRLVEYESHFDRYRNVPQPTWREEAGPGSGILFDLGSHLIDQAQVLFGLPHMITADIGIQREYSKIVDHFALILHYDQLKVTLKAGMLVREPGARFTLHGTSGSFVKFGLDPQEAALKKEFTPLEEGWGKEPEAQWGNLNTEISGLQLQGRIESLAGCYQAYYQNIAAVLAGQAELAVKPEEALNTIRIIELAMQSAAQRCTIAVPST